MKMSSTRSTIHHSNHLRQFFPTTQVHTIIIPPYPLLLLLLMVLSCKTGLFSPGYHIYRQGIVHHCSSTNKNMTFFNEIPKKTKPKRDDQYEEISKNLIHIQGGHRHKNRKKYTTDKARSSANTTSSAVTKGSSPGHRSITEAIPQTSGMQSVVTNCSVQQIPLFFPYTCTRISRDLLFSKCINIY